MELNKIYCGDCLEILRGGEILDKTIDLIVTDPPYKIGGHDRGISKDRDYLKKGMDKIGSTMDTTIYTKEFMDLLLCKLKAPNIIFFCNKMQIPEILDKAREYDLNFAILCLCKTAPTPLSNNQWLPDKEYAIHLYKNCEVKGNYKTKKTFWVKPNFKDKRYNHPTVKPLDIVEDIIMNCSNEGDTVLDCYLGSGTTAVACKELNRNFIGIEINPEYVELAENRLKELDRLAQTRLF